MNDPLSQFIWETDYNYGGLPGGSVAKTLLYKLILLGGVANQNNFATHPKYLRHLLTAAQLKSRAKTNLRHFPMIIHLKFLTFITHIQFHVFLVQIPVEQSSRGHDRQT